MAQLRRLLGIGGAHIDRRGQLFAEFVGGASNPGTMREEVGGGVFNALRLARQFGVQCAFLSARGGDIQGETVARSIKAAGIEDLSSTFLDRPTATYTAILDRSGEVIAALADMEIYETAMPRQITRRKTRDAIDACDAVLTDANMPAEAVKRLLALAGSKPVYAIAISPAKAVRLTGHLDRLHCVFMNMREAKALAGFAPADAVTPSDILESLMDAGLARAVISDGPSAVRLIDHGSIAEIAPPPARLVAVVTGAGDALAGMTIASLLNELPLQEAAQRGIAAAVANVESTQAFVDMRNNVRFLELLSHMNQSAQSVLEDLS